MNNVFKNTFVICAGMLLIIGSNIRGHDAPPFSIMSTPILLPVVMAGINYRLYRFHFPGAVAYSYGLLIFNDLLIRFYAGGTHDSEGKGWIFLSTAVAFVLSTSLLLFFAGLTGEGEQPANRRENFLALFFISVSVALFYCFVLADV